nr:hypothetical protein [Tanacetum cinerariifolium]
DLQGEEVVVEEVNVASIVTSVTATATTVVSFDELTLAQALMKIKTSKPKRAEEKRNKPPTKAQQRSLMSTYLKNMDGWKPIALKNNSFAEIKELFHKSTARINNFVDIRTKLMEENTKEAQEKIAQESSSNKAGDELEQEIAKKQKIEDENESATLKICLEIVSNDGDEVTIDATPLSVKTLIIDYKIYKEGRKKLFLNHQSRWINNFVDIRTKLVEENTKEAQEKIAQESSSNRAGDELEQEIAKKQKIEDENESATLKICLEIVSNDGDEVTIDATPLSVKTLIIDYKIYKEGRKKLFLNHQSRW